MDTNKEYSSLSYIYQKMFEHLQHVRHQTLHFCFSVIGTIKKSMWEYFID